MKQNTRFLTSTRRLVMTGMLISLIAVMMLTGIGFLQIGPAVAVTLLCLPVLIGTMAEGLAVGLLLGGAFGLISFAQSFTSPALLSPFFMNPLVSVLPRLLIPVITHLVFRAVLRVFAPLRRGKGIARGVAALVGSLSNTVFVLSMVLLMHALGLEIATLDTEALHILVLTAALTNGLPEALCMGLITPPILAALDRSLYKGG